MNAMPRTTDDTPLPKETNVPRPTPPASAGGRCALLLHACCGPCSTACVERLRAEGVEPVIYFANDNIDTREEFDRRREALEAFAAKADVEVHVKPYDHDAWCAAVRGLEGEPEGGARCSACFRHNLAAAAAFAAERRLPAFTSSLTVSPHKRSAQVFEAGHAVETPTVPFAEWDFKKRSGFQRSVALAAQYALYRQRYCGCEFSRRTTDPGPLPHAPHSDTLPASHRTPPP